MHDQQLPVVGVGRTPVNAGRVTQLDGKLGRRHRTEAKAGETRRGARTTTAGVDDEVGREFCSVAEFHARDPRAVATQTGQ